MREERKVEFVVEKAQAKAVAVAGTFNDWSPSRTPLRKNRDGTWSTRLTLAPGRYEYRFVIDGSWVSDPRAPKSVPNPLGTENSVIEVA